MTRLLRRLSVVVVGLVLAMVTGCATKPPCADDAFAKDPLAFRRVQVLPVIVTPAAHPDKTLTTNAVWEMNTAAATNLVHALCQSLQTYGFEVLGQPLIFDCPEHWSQLTDICASNIVVAHHELTKTSRVIFQRLDKEKGKLPDYRLTNTAVFACVEDLATNADAFVVVHSTVSIESRMERNKRRGEMAIANTVGILAAAFGGVGFWYAHPSPSGVQTTVAIVDARTFHVLWWNSWALSNVNLSDTNAVSHTMSDMMSTLPATGKQSRSHFRSDN